MIIFLVVALIISSACSYYFFSLCKLIKSKAREASDEFSRLNNALHVSQERLEFVTQNAIDGIIFISDNGTILSWNYGAEQMFGFKESEILGHNLKIVIPHGHQIKEEKAQQPFEMHAKRQNGEVFPVEVSHTHCCKKEHPFDTIIVRDITERKENEKRLIKAMRESRAANAAKDDFLAIISHELRTPLHAIIGFTECLLIGIDGPISLKQQESLKKIKKSSLLLLTLIGNILDLSKMQASQMELELETGDIAETLNSSVEEVRPMAMQKKLDIQIIGSKHPLNIKMDKLRIKQVLLNLLSNAIKFTDLGTIKIILSNYCDYVEIVIIDTGIGLTPDEMIKIFHPFSQADSSITRKYGGTGLGLIIAKKIIELHGGQLYVKSKKSEGSTFGFTIPKGTDIACNQIKT